jgi:hypothetical protein
MQQVDSVFQVIILVSWLDGANVLSTCIWILFFAFGWHTHFQNSLGNCGQGEREIWEKGMNKPQFTFSHAMPKFRFRTWTLFEIRVIQCIFLFHKFFLMSDKELYQLCKKYGAQVLEARRKFTGLLPEVEKRGLYARRGFKDIYEFCARLAGMTHEQVDVVFRIDKKLEDKPVLHAAFMNGEVSVNKLARILPIATKENQEEILEKAKLLPNRALEIYVREAKAAGHDGSNKPESGQLFLHVQELSLDEDVEKELSEMQKKGIDVNEFLRECLRERKEKIEEVKNKIGEEIAREGGEMSKNVVNIGDALRTEIVKLSRYIPAKIKKIIKEEYGEKCSMPGCMRLAKIIHHTIRYALTGNHDPRYLAPLCEGHHALAHAVDVKVQEIRSRASSAEAFD